MSAAAPDPAYQALRQTAGPCVLFESTTPAGPLSRRCLLARHPRALLLAHRDRAEIVTREGSRSLAGDPLAALRTLLAEVPPARWPEEGGVAGALAYDFARPGREGAPTPLLVALAVDRFLVSEDGRLAASDGPAAAGEGPP